MDDEGTSNPAADDETPTPAAPSAPPAATDGRLGDRATLSDVARRAGTSRQTVSNLLNAPHLVRPTTAERVREAITHFGYRPSRAARELRTNRSQLIAVRIESGDDELGGGVLDTFLHALTLAAVGTGYRIVLYTAADDDGEIAAFDELLSTLNVDAFVLTDTRERDRRTHHLARRGVPFVTFGRPWPADAPHPWVDVDSAAGVTAAVEHLIASHHRTIGFLGWDGDRVGEERRVGWQRTLEANGLPAEAFGLTPHDVNAAQVACSELLDRAQVSAIVCASDLVAIGAMRAVTARGLRIGDDVSLIGFDNIPAADVVGLSSIAQPVKEAAAECMRLILGVLLGSPAPEAQAGVLLRPRLVVRTSSAPPRAGSRSHQWLEDTKETS